MEDHANYKVNVLMVNNFYQIGGGEHTVFKNEVDLLKDHGHKVIEYTRSNVELKESKIKLYLSPFSTLWSFKTYREVKRIIKKQNIDIVHCHNTFPLISPSVYYAAKSLNIPLIQTIHNYRFLCPAGIFYHHGHICEKCRERNSFFNAIRNKCYRDSFVQTLVLTNMLRFHRIFGTYKRINYIFLSDFSKSKFDKLIDINGKNVFVKPNFVKEQNVDRSNMTDYHFVFAGRLDENKGIKTLLELWCDQKIDYPIHIYGDGPLRSYVENKANRFKSVKYFGFCSQTELYFDLRKAVALIFPSKWYEGFPMIISESFSLGCPVISSDIGNQAEIVKKSRAGVLFNLESASSFIDAISYTINNNKELSRYALSFALDYLSVEKNYLRLCEIYEQARHF